MTTTSRTWFYQTPESNAYAIGERVRTTFWDARVGELWLDTVRAEPPILMQGQHQATTVELEWQPGEWCTLRTKPGSPTLAAAVSLVLGFKPAHKYQDPSGRTVWEWRVADRQARWQAIQGLPEYAGLERLG